MPLPAAMLQRARDFTGPAAPARPAATVVLLRGGDAAGAFDVYVLRRATTMVFGGVHAFPGGGVDRDDLPQTINQDWPERLGVPEAEAKAVVGAAARELFEEAGVLLAGPVETGDDDLVGDVSGADWEADRLAVQRRELTMTELLAKRGLRLRDDLLLPWARWITPEFEPKRFDTWFFVAVLPPAQTARDVSGEADRTMWISPADANGLAMLPPTRVMLDELSAYRSISEVWRAQRDAAAPVMPRVELAEDGGAVLTIPSRSDR
ncbi:NUDIX hydrolase [Actinoplanes sp. NPDC049599]|uniref:NUDIX hydrolase n=1 Tax=Actinoplanes sp. NPDC049599 TaxID=3363903 RepID=UPI003796DB53